MWTMLWEKIKILCHRPRNPTSTLRFRENSVKFRENPLCAANLKYLEIRSMDFIQILFFQPPYVS